MTNKKADKIPDRYWFSRLVCHILRFLLDSGGSASVINIQEHLEKNHRKDIERLREEYHGKNHLGIGKYWKWVCWYGKDYQDSGLLQCLKGEWHITPFGKKVLKRLDCDTIIKQINKDLPEHEKRRGQWKHLWES